MAKLTALRADKDSRLLDTVKIEKESHLIIEVPGLSIINHRFPLFKFPSLILLLFSSHISLCKH